MNVFQPRESVSSNRLRLSHLDTKDIDAMPWLTDALAPEYTIDDLWVQVAAGNGVLIADKQTKQTIGAAVALLNAPKRNAASVPFIGITPERRFRGLGGEAGLALERYLCKKRDVKRVYAPVPEARGLAVYFWLRLGYRPLAASAALGPLLGLGDGERPGIWLVRDA